MEEIDNQKICLNCGKCCFETEMILAPDEIKTIKMFIKENFKTSDFSFYKFEQNTFYLKNKKNKCVFLTKKKGKYECKIYDVRPFGCRLYPMIYDMDRKQCVFDEYCPHYGKFYINEKKFKLSCIELTRFIKNLFKDKAM